jgi:hypothetical protein
MSERERCGRSSARDLLPASPSERCFCCGKDLRGRLVSLARAYEADALYRLVKVCADCRLTICQLGFLQVERDDEVYTVRPELNERT